MLFLKNEINLLELVGYSDFAINHVVEVGVWTPKVCRAKPFILAGKRVELFEPEPNAYQQLADAYKNYPNTKVFNLAITDHEGTETLVWCDQGSFLANVEKPPLIQDDPLHVWTKNYYETRPKMEVKCDTFEKYDDGTIDMLLLDMESSEWHVINRLKSRPRIVGVETHHENRSTNPFIKEIHDWMNRNYYKVWFRNTLDSYFIRGNDYGWGPGGNENWKL